MFGADIGQLSMLDAGRGFDNGGLDRLEYLLPRFHHQLPWKHDQKQTIEDFILIAEFSEQEGPRPVIVIPEGGGKHFDQNEFSVKILAVDHQSSIVEGCHMTEDAQVVMADSDQGAYAFIHHIVLNDIQARGYVRPFCITYVTTDSMKIMKCYEKLSAQLKEVARLMKFGNRLVFMRDLEKRLEDLDYTKTQLLISQSRAQTSSQGDSDLLNTLNTIRQSMEEVKDILASVKKQLMDKELEERFEVYERRLKASLQRNVDHGETASLKDYSSSEYSTDGEMSGSYTCSSEFSLFNKSKDLKPKLLDVSTIGGKRRFDRSLRGLHELCSWGAKEGLQKLRFVRQGLKRDLSSIMMEDFDYSIMSPYSGVLSFGCSSVGANFLSACNSSTDVCCLKRRIVGMGEQFNHLSSFDSFKSLPSSYQSVLDDDTMYSVNSSVVDSIYERQNSDQGFDEYGVTFYTDDEMASNERKELETTLRNSLTQTATRLDTNIPSQAVEQCGRHSDVSEYDSISIDKDLKCVARGCSCEETSKTEESVGEAGCIGAKGNNCCDTVGVSRRVDKGKCVIKEQECSKNDIIVNKDLGNVSQQVECDDENCFDTAFQNARHASQIFESVNASEDDMEAIETDNPALSVGLTDSTSTLTDLNLAKLEKALVEVSENDEKDISDPENNDVFELCDEEREDIETPQPSMFLDTNCDETSVINTYNESNIDSASANSQNDSESSVKADNNTVRAHTKIADGFKVSEITNKDTSIPSEGSASSWPKTRAEIEDSGTDFLCHSFSGSSGDMPDTSDLRLMYGKGGYGANMSKTSDTESLRSSIEGQQSLVRKRLRLNSHTFTTDADDVTVTCVQRVLTSYNNLQHVIYSLLAGKPVVVIATEKHEAAMKQLVKALSVFTPVVPGGVNIGLVCQIKQLKVAEVRKFQLRGMIRHDRRAVDFLIPLSVRRYLTLVDLDKMLVYCHPYQGPLLNFISAIHHKRLSLKSDQALFRFIQMQLLDISTKAFTFYHSISSADKELDFSGATLPRKSFMLELCAEKYLSQSGHVSSDYRIIKHLSEIVKLQQINEEFRAKFLTDAPVHPFRMSYQSMQTYRM